MTARSRTAAVAPRPADILLGAGLVLSFATQLRPDALPLGPGELCLLVGLAGELAAALRDPDARTTRVFWTLALFWSALAGAELLGFTVGGAVGDLRDGGLVVHDAMTLPLLAGLGLLLGRGPDPEARLTRVLLGMMAVAGPVLGIELLGGAGLAPISGVDPWYWDRFRGWASNPNQLALACLLVAALGIEASRRTDRWGRAACLATAATALAAGLLTKTNAFNLAVAVAGAVGLALGAVEALARPGTPPGLRLCAAAALIGVPLVASLALPFAASLQTPTWASLGLSRDGADTGDEAKIRIELWRGAFARSLESRFLGLGPGPHLPIPSILLDARWGVPYEPINVQHPTPGMAPNFESHNSVLELLLQGGLLAVAAFGAVMAAAVRGLWRSHSWTLLAATFGMMLFGSFHVITRHPAVWFTVSLGLAAGEGQRGRTTGARLEGRY